MSALAVLGDAAVVAGVALLASAALGVLRMPDVYTRANVMTKAAGLGIVLVLVGTLALRPGWENAAKTALAVALQLVTAPVSGLAVGQAARRSGAPLAPVTGYDELADGREPRRSAPDGG